MERGLGLRNQSDGNLVGFNLGGRLVDNHEMQPDILNDADQRPGKEPVAIIGIGCRFPGGANSPEAFWELLRQGRDAIVDAPPDRWDLASFYDPDPTKPGKLITRKGGFLENVDQFDADFFGISPREAQALDPQQRLLLEVAWESLEDAGLAPDRLAGRNVGVFIGAFTLDYKVLQFKSPELINAHTAVGSMMTIVAARLSYAFDFRGPGMSIDTACSSSLVAIHLACQSLWNGECELALAGGVNVMTSPEYAIAESKGGFLSPDGHSKAFDARANGYARGEGAGIAVLKPLSAALADGDPIYAVIRGTAVNQDGHTSGITVPRLEAQVALMQDAYQRAGVSPGKVHYVEAHGTGTPVGDPIEAHALATVLAVERPADSKCVIGSCKTNIGHLEAAAGIAGLIKAALCLKNRQIPPHLHLQNPNPAIRFDELCIRVPTSLEPWPDSSATALASVNSFGFGGTNAHVVLEEAPEPSTGGQMEGALLAPGRAQLIPLSARNPEALRAVAQTYRGFLASCQDFALSPSFLHSLSVRRSHHDHRLAIVAQSKEELVEHLEAFLAEESRPHLSSGRRIPGQDPRLVFVFTGMGPQWWAMGRELFEHEPVFRETVEECDRLFQQHSGWSVLQELLADEAASRIEETEVAQPANAMLQLGLAALWRAWGIVPEVIVGHSVGEIAAAHVAGILSLEDTMKVAFHRSRLQQQATGKGRMMAVGLSADEARRLLNGYEDRVSIGAINSPSSVTLSGDAQALEELGKQLTEKQIFNRFLHVKIPYHSCHMDFMKEELLSSLRDLEPSLPTVKIFSTALGQAIEGRAFDADYWWLNVRQTVQFAQAIRHIIQDGNCLFVEIGPHPVLATSISECLAAEGQKGIMLPSLRRKEPERATLLGSLGAMYTAGYPVDWSHLYGARGEFMRLPSYPWQRSRYWLEGEEPQRIRLGQRDHPLLGRRLRLPHPGWESELHRHSLSYLDDHCIQGAVVYPGAAYIEMGLAAAKQALGAQTCALENIRFRRALFLPGSDSPQLYTLLNPQEAVFDIYSRPLGENQSWSYHASGRLRQLPDNGIFKKVPLDDIRKQCPEQVTKEDCYRQFRAKGFHYGPSFQGIEQLWRGIYDALALIQIPPDLEADFSSYQLHPVLLDNCFQTLIAIGSFGKSGDGQQGEIFLPVGVDRIHVYARPGHRMWSHAHIVEQNDQTIVGDVHLCDEAGNLIVDIQGFRARSVAAAQGVAADKLEEWLYEIEWQPMPLSPEQPATESPIAQHGLWLVLGDQGGTGQALAARIQENGDTCILASPAESYQIIEQGQRYAINPAHSQDFERLFNDIAGASALPWRGIVHLWSLDAPPPAATTPTTLKTAQERGCLAVMNLVKAMVQMGKPARLWLVTRGAQPVGDDAPLAVAQSPLWGMGRLIGHQEHVGFWGGLIDLDPAAPADAVSMLFQQIWNPDNEDQIALRGTQRYVARLVHSHVRSAQLPPQIRSDGSYLITGGLGALGLLVARWLVRHGARRLVLLGRKQLPPREKWDQSGPFAGQIAAIRELEAMGAAVRLASLDVADETQLTTFLDDYQSSGEPPIRGIFHAAGMVQDQLLLQMETETFDAVLRPKVQGAWALHRAFEHLPLDFFILFSSSSSIIAQTGQCNYAAGNAFLDALSFYRRSIGLPALSINWGPWAVGMIKELNLIEHYVRRGMASISEEAGTQLLGRLFGYSLPQVIVVSANWPLVLEYYARPPLFMAHLGQGEDATSAGTNPEDDLRHKFAQAGPAERHSLVTAQVLELLARALRMDRAKLDPQMPLISLGMDSLIATELKNRIDVAMGVSPTIVELLQGFNTNQIADRLVSQLQSSLQEEKVTAILAKDRELSVEGVQELAALVDSESVKQLLTELEGLSDDQVQQMLSDD